MFDQIIQLFPEQNVKSEILCPTLIIANIRDGIILLWCVNYCALWILAHFHIISGDFRLIIVFVCVWAIYIYIFIIHYTVVIENALFVFTVHRITFNVILDTYRQKQKGSKWEITFDFLHAPQSLRLSSLLPAPPSENVNSNLLT